jgi:hypothetical protein
MAIILDADVIIGGEKGTFDLQRWVAARPDEQFVMILSWRRLLWSVAAKWPRSTNGILAK